MTSGKFSLIRFASSCLLLGLLAALPAAAELPTPLLVGDHSPGLVPNDFPPRHLAEIGGLLYFTGNDDQHGEEPWVSDGTAAGTRLIADLCPGTCGSEVEDFAAVGSRIVFFSSTNEVLYALDGGQVVPIHHGFSSAGGFVRLGSVLYFSAAKYQGVPRMWRTDGTAAGTRESPDFCTGTSCDGRLDFYGAANGVLYFARDGQFFALVAEGERRVLASLEYALDPTPLDATRAIFAGCTAEGCSAWVSDGTAAGTFDLDPDGGVMFAAFDPFVAWRGRLYFANGAGQMVSIDGTTAGTHSEPSFVGERVRPVAANDGYLLYAVDSSSGQTVLRARHSSGGDNLLAGPSSGFFQRHRPGRLGEKIFFTDSHELFATDGTPAGTTSLGEYFSGLSDGVVFGGRYLFGGAPQGAGVPGLFGSDGTAAGTTKVELGLLQPRGSEVTPYRLGGSLLADYGGLLHRVDPEDFTASPVFNQLAAKVAAGRDLFYANLFDDPEPLRAVGEDTVATLPAGLVTDGAVAADDHLFFTDATPGQELIESDGTAAGTRELFDLLPGSVVVCVTFPCPADLPQYITPSGDRVFFLGPNTGGPGTSIWAWQRGQAAPVELRQREQIFFSGFSAIPGGVLFTAFTDGPQPKSSLWISDGTVAGTRPLPNLPSRPTNVVALGNRIFFTSLSSLAATDLATTYYLGSAEAVEEVVVAGDRVFFAGRKPGEGVELGVTDGTPDGTRWLDLRPGLAGSYPRDLFATGDGRVVFGAAADGAGYELWISDGTEAGTYRLTDLAPGIAASSPHNFAQVGQRLFFRASDGVVGQELWALDLPAAGEGLPPCPADRLCLHHDRFEVRVTAHAPDGDFPGRRALAGAESGVFTFFSPDNWEMTVKVLDGCHLNEAFWVYAAAASDLDYTLTVKDRASGLERTWSGAAQAGQPVLDSEAFASCGLPAPAAEHSSAGPTASPARRCADDLSTFCFGPEGRYRLRLDWQLEAAAGQAKTVPDGSADAGLFTFFSPTNWELMVKLLDGCAANGHRWVFAAGTTTVGWKLTVTDRQTGASRIYENPLGQPSQTVADGTAFACDGN